MKEGGGKISQPANHNVAISYQLRRQVNTPESKQPTCMNWLKPQTSLFYPHSKRNTHRIAYWKHKASFFNYVA